MKQNAWWIFAAVLAPLAVLNLYGPDALRAGPVFNVFGLAAVAAVAGGVRLHRPAVSAPWLLLALGLTFFAAGDAVTYNYGRIFGGEQPFPSAADPLYLAFYPTIVVGMLILIRRRNPGRDWASLIDSLIVVTGLALLSWVFLMAPYLRDSQLSTVSKLVSMGYPLMDMLLLGVTVRLAAGRGERGPSYAFMICSMAGLLVTDSVYGWNLLHGGYEPGGLLDAGWICSYVLFGAAALHPSMARVSETTGRAGRMTRSRLGVLALAAAVAPVLQLLESARDGGVDSVVIPAGAIGLFGLVVARMVVLVRAQEAAARHERTLREAGDALVTATSTHDIVRAAADMTRALAGQSATGLVLRIVEHEGATALTPWAEGVHDADGPDRAAPVPADVAERLQRRIPTGVRSSTLPALLAGPGSLLLYPFFARGELAGALAVATEEPRLESPIEAVLESLALQVGLALESAELTQHVMRAENEARFSALIQQSSDVIFLLSPELAITYVSPAVAAILGFDPSALAGRSFSDLIEPDDRPVALGALTATTRRGRGPSELLEFRVTTNGGSWLHAEALVTNLLEAPEVAGIVVTLRDITERKSFERQLTHQAFHDPVTGLANRALFRDRIGHALQRRDTGAIAVLFLDIDDFKVVNDTLGHLAGDTLLQQMGARLASALRAGDTAARLGGDEFGILLEGAEGQADVEHVAQRLLTELRTPFVLDGEEVSVQASIGVVVTRDLREGDDFVEELLRDADIAMYQAKSQGKASYAVFRDDMRTKMVERHDLHAELKGAIERDELSLVYQPIVDLSTGAVAGLEALSRWESKRFGPVPPSRFIPLAEETGLIVPIGAWVLDTAIAEAAALRAELSPAPGWMTVNVSAWQLQRAEFVADVRAALDRHRLEPGGLVLEITESMMMRDMELAVSRLTELRELGVMIAVDDFGTGYSSLTHIRSLPINMLKVDKSFVDRLHEDDDQRKLTATIVELARVLNLMSVAEGVEHAAQLRELQALGCAYAQGFHLARPLPRAELRELLASGGVRLAA